jgi:predicted O-linked N-acetylglucosamine transferase (SPINDLY family)
LTPRQLIDAAVAHHQAGRVDEAERVYRQVLDEHPDQADAWHLLGLLTAQRGNREGARQLIRRAIELDPSADLYHVNLGSISGACGDNAEAAACLRRAIDLNPKTPPAVYVELGQALSALGETDAAIKAFDWAVKQEPTPRSLVLLGELLQRAGRQQEALQRLREAIQMAPDLAEAHGALGVAMQREGRLEEAEACYRKAIALDPELAQAYNNLGQVLNLRQKWPEAIVVLNRAVELQPELAPAYNLLGDAFRGLDRPEGAITCYRRALDLDPNLQPAWDALGQLLLQRRDLSGAADALRHSTSLQPTAAGFISLGRSLGGFDHYDGALDAFREAVRLAPESAEAHRWLGAAQRWCGMLDEAVRSFRRAIGIDPADHVAHSHLLYTMLFHGGFTPEQIYAEHVKWGQRHTGSIQPLPPPTNDRATDRRLRVGYISPNFRNQAVLFFVLPILLAHDPWEVEVFCYSDTTVVDEWTARVRDRADEWRDSSGLTDEALARMIRNDQIDILVELTGHIGDGRLHTLAYKPAPVQVSYIGYQATTGAPAVDYFLSDDWADPAGASDASYVERVIRLPESFFVYGPPPEAPPVGPLPARAKSWVTFGCQNNLAKVTPRTIELWSKILLAVPNSRFMLLAPGSKEVDERLFAAFESHGVARQRIEIVRRATPREYLERYNRIDLGLDPVPFNGHTTTCDAAWMGCPTVIRAGSIYAHRYGGSVMRNVGCEDLVAENDENYVRTAVDLATDLNLLEQLRVSLRDRMARSIITDRDRFTRNLEHAYRKMWKSWCASAR